jgi:NAD(P)-dependent dehydrogenase (short-subunit alcohol dehydrogenase family)
MNGAGSTSERVMLVTGGSRGIGAATARLAASRGWSVAVNYRSDRAAADAVVAEIERAGGRAVAIAADVAVESDVLRLFEEVDRRLGRLHALVNNAGVVAQAGRVDTIDLARLQRMFGINVFGTFLCARQAVLRMSTRHGGTGGVIVNVSSAAARLGSPGEYVDYAASKGAVDSMTIGLAREVATEGIRVNAVRPGLIATDIHASGGEPGRAERLRPAVPMQRVGTDAEVAAAILWLASDEASYATGALLDVSGGR